jgi:hypothetical protein
MSRTLERMPNYTCLQTIERTTRRAPGKRYELVDMVRLQVALVEGRELFSWPGATKFDDREISDIVTGGAIGNGNFAIHAQAVFRSNIPTFTFVGEVQRNDRRMLRWDFVVPQFRSGYTLRARPQEAVVGYHGSFWVDADSLDLLRLEVQADDIPPQLRISQAQDAIEYSRVKIGDSMFLLPSGSEMTITDTTGSENRNRTRFTACQQYTGESVISFDDPSPERSAKVEPQVVNVPAGLSLDLVLDTPIRSGASAVGDPVTAALKKAVKISPELMAPKGALVHGRITLLRQQNNSRDGYAVAIQFFEIEFGNTRGRMSAKLETVAAATNIYSTSPFGVGGRIYRAPQQFDQALAVPGSVFFVRGYNLNVERGLRMLWRTESLQPEDNQ